MDSGFSQSANEISSRNVRVVDTIAIEENVRLIRWSLPSSTKVCAVVKADGYGHGAVEAAKAAVKAGAEYLAVATVMEGVQIRQSHAVADDINVLMLGVALDEELEMAVSNSITLSVCDTDMVYQLEKISTEMNKVSSVHIKLDTGMNRIGAKNESEVKSLMESLAKCPHVHLTGAFTHFAVSDSTRDEDVAYTRCQLNKFVELLKLLPDDIIAHCANSAASLRWRDILGENPSEQEKRAMLAMVRLGIVMYGYPEIKTSVPVKPCMEWYCRVEYVKKIAKGEKVGYGCTFTAAKDTVIATVTCGYGDGYLRSGSNRAKVIINGKLCLVVGRICMDQLMVDVSEAGQVNKGDIVTLMGKAGKISITADDIAAWCGTISYEVLLSAPETLNRINRIYK